MKDPISNMLVELKNASSVGKGSVVFTYSKFKMAILEMLVRAGFIESAVKKGKKVVKYIEVVLAYDNDNPRIHDISRVSKTAKRVYRKSSDIRPFKNGYGMTVFSTPKGILSDMEARKEKVGGEVLFTIW